MKIFKISKSRVQKYLRDMFVNSIGGGGVHNSSKIEKSNI